MRLHHRSVTVVGAGIAGCAAALLLARRGADVVLFERDERPASAGAGLALAPNGLAVLYGLGLEEPLRAAGVRTPSLPVFGEGGRLLVANRMPDDTAGPDHFLLIRRARLLAILHSALDRDPHVRTEFGVAISTVDPTGGVHVSAAAVADADPFLVLGADGTRSVVRPGVAGPDRARAPGRVYVRGLVPRVSGRAFSEHWTATGIFGVADVGDATYWYASARQPRVYQALGTGDLECLRRVWSAAHPRAPTVLARVDAPDDLLVSEVLRVDCERYASGRIALLGDAAHAMAPTSGQGANSALVDAAVLAAELDAGPDLATTLAAYSRRRRQQVRAVQDLADRTAWLAEHTSPAVRHIRDRALPLLMGRAPSSPRRLQRVWQEPLGDLYDIAART